MQITVSSSGAAETMAFEKRVKNARESGLGDIKTLLPRSWSGPVSIYCMPSALPVLPPRWIICAGGIRRPAEFPTNFLDLVRYVHTIHKDLSFIVCAHHHRWLPGSNRDGGGRSPVKHKTQEIVARRG